MTIRRLPRLAGALGVLALPLAPLALAGSAHADTGSPAASVSASAGAGPTTAGSSFRTATPLASGRTAQAGASTGDYLYWSFQAAAGQAPSVTATVQLPPAAQRHAGEDWRLDLYDGLRRNVPCVSGRPQASAAADGGSVQLSCTLPGVRGWAESWSNDPLPGTYYVRLTVADLNEQDLGLPVTAQVTLATPSSDADSSDGSLAAPLSLPSAGPSQAPAAADPGATQSPASATGSAAAAASGGGSSSGFFSGGNARWWWTGGGAVAASLTAVLGFSLTRHPRRWFS